MKNVRKMLLLFLCVVTLGLTACGTNDANGTDGTYDNNNNNVGTENGNIISDTVEGVGEGIRDTVDGIDEGVNDTMDNTTNNNTNNNTENNTKNNNR